MGAVLTEEERPEEAIKILLQAIKLQPDHAEAHCNIATAFALLEELDKAHAGFNRALQLRPDYNQAHVGLASIYIEQNNFDEADASVNKAMALAPDSADVHSLRGEVLVKQGFPEEAHKAYDKALELDDQSLSAHLGKGRLLMEQGQLKESEECYLHALSLDQDGLSARLSLAQVKKVREGDENLIALEAEADKVNEMPEIKAMSLHFSLGKCYDDLKNYDRAFPHFLEGCRLKRKKIHYDPDNNELACRNICNFFDEATIERLSGGGNPSNLPIFVLGMPRSGTTLTEQIIASHPDAYGAGELPDLLALANTPIQQGGEKGYPLSLKGITKDDLARLGAQYAEGLQKRCPDAAYITDKMPANFFCVGLIHLMLPNAKIVHVNRNPVDTCLSGFSRLFNNSQYHTYDLSEIGRYYRNYAALMDHWRKVLPEGAFLDLQYEELVADHEAQAHRLIEYCGLEWNDSCLDFHKHQRSVRTASVTQVRQPVYTSSVDRWRRYEAHLQPLIDALGDLAPQR